MAVRNWSIASKLAAAFGVVVAIFAVATALTLVFSASAQNAWKHTAKWDRATAGAADQVGGAKQQQAAQALYAATFDPRYKAEWERGVALGERGAAIVSALGDPVIARISRSAIAADHRHDAAVHNLLFPAVARGDHRAALAALRLADRCVRVPLAAQEKIAARIDALRNADQAKAAAAASRARIFGILAALVGALLAAGLGFLFVRALRGPLALLVERMRMLQDHCIADLKRAMQALAEGDLTVVLHPSTPPIENPAGDEV